MGKASSFFTVIWGERDIKKFIIKIIPGIVTRPINQFNVVLKYLFQDVFVSVIFTALYYSQGFNRSHMRGLYQALKSIHSQARARHEKGKQFIARLTLEPLRYILTPDASQRITNLTKRDVIFHAFNEEWHQVLGTFCRHDQFPKQSLYRFPIPRFP